MAENCLRPFSLLAPFTDNDEVEFEGAVLAQAGDVTAPDKTPANVSLFTGDMMLTEEIEELSAFPIALLGILIDLNIC